MARTAADGEAGYEAALVERPDLKDELAVEHQSRHTFVVFAKSNLSHAEVAGRLVHRLAVSFKRHA